MISLSFVTNNCSGLVKSGFIKGGEMLFNIKFNFAELLYVAGKRNFGLLPPAETLNREPFI